MEVFFIKGINWRGLFKGFMEEIYGTCSFKGLKMIYGMDILKGFMPMIYHCGL